MFFKKDKDLEEKFEAIDRELIRCAYEIAHQDPRPVLYTHRSFEITNEQLEKDPECIFTLMDDALKLLNEKLEKKGLRYKIEGKHQLTPQGHSYSFAVVEYDKLKGQLPQYN